MCQVTDRFFAAVRTLTGEGQPKQRLIAAYVDQLETLPDADVPEAIRPRFDALRRAMTAVPATEKETSVQVSVRKMSPQDAARFTRSIVTMFGELVCVRSTGERLGSGTGQRPQAVSRVPEGFRVPAFLARS